LKGGWNSDKEGKAPMKKNRRSVEQIIRILRRTALGKIDRLFIGEADVGECSASFARKSGAAADAASTRLRALVTLSLASLCQPTGTSTNLA
jgi:hypothetical protein